jgi:Ca2+-binding RTX toxin-like protein
MTFLTAAGFLAVAFAGAGPVAAEPRYVTPGGATSGSCAPPPGGGFYQPCELEHALTVSADGDEVIVDPGDYALSGTVGETDNVTIHGISGQPRPHVTVDNGVGQLQVVDPAGGTVRHLQIDGRLRLGGAAKVAEDVVIHGGLSLIGNTLVRDSVVTGELLALDASSGNHELRNVTVVSTGANSTAIRVSSPNPPTCAFARVTAKNVIAHGEAFDIDTRPSPCPQFAVRFESSHSNYRAANVPGDGLIDQGNNQTNAPPVFVNFAAGDYHQAPTSPTIDGGTTDSLLGTADIDGESRTLGVAPDIGADESPIRDRDGDGVLEPADNCVGIPNPDQADHEGDGQGDPCDADDDNDGVTDEFDSCPLDPSGDRRDTDGDGLDNPCDPDDDNDGVLDGADAFPLDPKRSAPAARCAGRQATIVGTNGRDRIRGTRRRDVIAARGGNDVISGLGGNDLICGGAGGDKIAGGRGRDELRGDAGNDRLLGQGGNDLLLGGLGRDRLLGGGGRDLLGGGPGRDLERQ